MFYYLLSLALIALVSAYYFIKNRADPNRNLPSVSLPKLLYYFIKQIPLQIRDKDLLLPLFQQNKYIKFWFGKWFIMVADLELIKAILMDSQTFIKFNQNEQFKEIVSLDKNIASIDGNDWKRHKRVINPAFKRGWEIDTFIKIGIKMIQYMKLNEGQFELTKVLKSSTLDSLGLSIFDVDFDSIYNESSEIVSLYVKLIESLNNLWIILFPFLEKLPIPSRMQLKKDAARFRQLIKSIIDDKREEIKEDGIDEVKSSLLTMLIQSSDKDNNDYSNGLTDEEIINDVIIFFIAGHDTTAHTLSTILYLLSKNQDIQDKLRNEVYQVLGGKANNISKSIKITQEELNKMIYLEAVIIEGMRNIPVVSALARQASKDYYFNNEILLKKGQPLLLNFSLAMSNEKMFKCPEEFNPDRFLIKNGDGKIQINKKLTKDMIGFSVGPRMCIGTQFSILEQKIFLILLILNFKIELPDDSIHKDYPILSTFGLSSPQNLKLNFIPL
ncbi:cytochrome P450 [Neoconidiobolus thromboides FSU 785]|nr:cytochrome P450 [Neoconidiobolus thromboides FSU 785]